MSPAARQVVTAALAEHFGCDADNIERWPEQMREAETERMVAEQRAGTYAIGVDHGAPGAEHQVLTLWRDGKLIVAEFGR